MTPGYARLEDQPVRYTATEAWILFEGTWNEIHPAEVYEKAKVLSRAEYESMFPQALRRSLPKTAFQSAAFQSASS